MSCTGCSQCKQDLPSTTRPVTAENPQNIFEGCRHVGTHEGRHYCFNNRITTTTSRRRNRNRSRPETAMFPPQRECDPESLQPPPQATARSAPMSVTTTASTGIAIGRPQSLHQNVSSEGGKPVAPAANSTYNVCATCDIRVWYTGDCSGWSPRKRCTRGTLTGVASSAVHRYLYFHAVFPGRPEGGDF